MSVCIPPVFSLELLPRARMAVADTRLTASLLPNARILHYIGERSFFLRGGFLSTTCQRVSRKRLRVQWQWRVSPWLWELSQSLKSLALWMGERKLYMGSPMNGWVLTVKSQIGNTEEWAHASDVKPLSDGWLPDFLAIWRAEGVGHLILPPAPYNMAAGAIGVVDPRSLMFLP